jgi:pyruvate dehydrogenase E2 component (dihydrolipoamide acetyltransferase)
MAEIIRMPRMSDTMTEGVIVAWHKKVGDTVKSGDLMAEVETDKATMELESYNNGTILYIGVEAGKAVEVNGVLAIIGKAGEEYASLLSGETGGATTTPEAATTAPVATATIPTIDITKMEEVVLMPRMSDTMTEGVIAAWHKKVGDTVKSSDLLAEVETDKATMELESYVNGTLLHIGVEKGGKVPVNQLLAIIGDATKVDVAAIIASAQVLANGGAVTNEAAVPAVSTATTAPVSNAVASENTTATSTDNGKLKASPLAKKLAKEKGIDIAAVNGSGDGGRIVKRDIDSFTPIVATPAAAVTAAVTPTAPAFVAGAGEGYSDTVNSQMRKTIARRLSESKFTAPHFYLKMEVNMDNAMAARKAMNEVSPVKISFQDMMIKACAMALRQHPAVNSSWMGDFIRTYQHIHVGSAVAVEDGLIVPVFKFADQKSLSQIATEANDLYTKAKTKKLQPQEFTGNTFTISNLGMMDIDEFTAIVNPPDSAILAVGKIKEVVVKKGEGFGVANMLILTLSCDHRIVDGAVGARFLQTLKAFLENPVNMLV